MNENELALVVEARCLCGKVFKGEDALQRMALHTAAEHPVVTSGGQYSTLPETPVPSSSDDLREEMRRVFAADYPDAAHEIVALREFIEVLGARLGRRAG